VTPTAHAVVPAWSRRLWLLAAPLALGWFAFWGLLWSPAAYTPPCGAPRFPPHARFLPGRTAAEGGEAQHDLRVMWSPVLFALPTAMGFSRTSAAGGGHARPRVERPSIAPRLQPPPAATTPVAVISATALPAFVTGDHLNADNVPPVFAPQPAVAPDLMVELLGALATLQPLEKPLPALPPELASDSWGVRAQLEVGRAGNVQHVFLDPPLASTNFNAQLLQALYRWRFAPAPTESHGAIRLYHGAAPRLVPSEVAQP
jgi:hypothetical protein